MSEPLDMSKARNVYSGERELFRRKLQLVLKSYDNVPINYDIRTHLHFQASDLKAESLKNYREATRNIISNQLPLQSSAARNRALADSEETFNLKRILPAKIIEPIDIELNVDEFFANRRRE